MSSEDIVKPLDHNRRDAYLHDSLVAGWDLTVDSAETIMIAESF